MVGRHGPPSVPPRSGRTYTMVRSLPPRYTRATARRAILPLRYRRRDLRSSSPALPLGMTRVGQVDREYEGAPFVPFPPVCATSCHPSGEMEESGARPPKSETPGPLELHRLARPVCRAQIQPTVWPHKNDVPSIRRPDRKRRALEGQARHDRPIEIVDGNIGISHTGRRFPSGDIRRLLPSTPARGSIFPALSNHPTGRPKLTGLPFRKTNVPFRETSNCPPP